VGPTRQADTVARLRLVLLRLARRIRQQAETAVTPSQLSALSTVERDGPLRLGALAERERIGKSTLTRIVAALEDAGCVDRAPDRGDGRCAVISISEDGRALLAASRQRADAYLAGQVAALTVEERSVLEAAVPVLERLLEVPA
jgi:DNA-binding MarR family transcriptional regulator